MAKRRLLAILDSNPFPASDGKTYPIEGQIRGLSQWWEIDVLEVHNPNTKHGFETQTHHKFARSVFSITAPKPAGKLQKLTSEIVAGQPYFLSSIADNAQLTQVIGNRTYDAIYVSPLGLSDWATAVASGQPERPKLVLNQNDSITERFRRDFDLFKLRVLSWKNSAKHLLQSLRATYMASIEEQIYSKFDLILVQTKRDRDAIIADVGRRVESKLLVASNGLKPSLLELDYQQHSAKRLLHIGGLSRNRRDLVFWFLKEVFLPVQQQLPDITIQLAGSMSDADRKMLQQMPGVQPLGFVDDVRDVLMHATMSVAPLFMRSGLVNKILDSMAAGVPSSGTKAFNGFPGFVNGTHGFDVVDAESWQRLLKSTLCDPQLLSKVSEAGRKLVNENLRWEITIDRLHSRLCDLVDHSASDNKSLVTHEESLVA